MERWYLFCADVGEWRVDEGVDWAEGVVMESTALGLRGKD